MADALSLTQSFHPAFAALLKKLRTTYPAELFTLTGIAPEQLDINAMSREFFRMSNRKGSATADHSIDPNANVSGRDVITFNYEVSKPYMKLNSLYNLWLALCEQFTRDDANAAIEAEIRGTLYINDSWDIGRPYCFNYSMYDIALEGLKMGGRLNIVPARGLFTFLRHVEQFTVYAANSTLGATGLADLLIVVSRYVDDILDTGYDNHIKVGGESRAWTYVREHLTSLIYTLNWEFRGNQSPFTNVSVYDEHFLQQLVPTYVINGKAPRMETVKKVQTLFLECFNAVLERDPATFPVVTACFSLVEGSRELADPAFVRSISEQNLKFGFINIYVGETSTLSSCCRLRSNINDLGYANSFGAGSTKIGSLGVCTLNLPALARDASAETAGKNNEIAVQTMLETVDAMTQMAGIINHAKRRFIADRIRRGSLPLYSLGYMELKRQFSTCGFTGLYEAVQILGYDMREPEGLEVARRILERINQTNTLLTEWLNTPHNMEQVPGESSAVKLARKDSLRGHNPEGYALYSNQFVPLWEEGVDMLDRIRIQGELDSFCTGGAICHLNVADRITKPETMEALIRHAAASGVVYFAINYAINRCADGHMTVGHKAETCPICNEPVTDTYTRVVGFLTNTKHWNATRREHDWPRRTFASKKE